ncbi:PDZ domain-containing protein [Methanosarcina sp. KYL-1]|uniref:site-2 protease family protein n=1 Tax=Methanosarcina sp. KYL-1 TaxID=2602068 RepID=UPI0021011AF8|nr:site-2 protease family protein [Methanosarcina sp. KYL-1]MCQ1536838.1 PDZ domain-containing protein [Methanosarcina sp. KYL-1]
MSGTSIALGIFLLYWFLVSILDRRGILEKYNISTFGPFPILMIRTTKGLKLLDILARPRFYWRVFANLGIWLMFAGMIAMFLIIVLSDIAMYTSFLNNNVPEPSRYNAPRNILLIPGLNEFIPFTWGVIALIVTLVVHEFSHAILCRVEGVRVKSMGILLALVPIGGFAEPDDEQLFGKKERAVEKEEEPPLTATIEEIEEWEREEKQRTELQRTEPKALKVEEEAGPVKTATRNQRARILAAGVMANFFVAFVAFLLFFGPVLGAIAPLSDAMVVGVSENSPAGLAGIQENMVIIQIDDTNITNAMEVLSYLETVKPGDTVSIHALQDGVASVHEVETVSLPEGYISGVLVGGVVPESPAEAAGFEPGMVMLRIDGREMHSAADFVEYMESTRANQTVKVELQPSENYSGTLTENGTVVLDVKLAPHYSGSGQGFLGVSYGQNGVVECPKLGVSLWMPQSKFYLDALKQIPSMLTNIAGWLILLGLPIYGFAGEGFRGFSGTIAQFYQPVGWAEPLGVGIFWIANSLLWIGWLNFYVGLFNCLPAVPLDGGHVFKDYTYSLVYRFTRNEAVSAKVSNSISASFSMLILLSFIFMIFGPFVGQWV